MVMDEKTKEVVKKMFSENMKDDVQMLVLTKETQEETSKKYTEVVIELANELKEIEPRIKVSFEKLEESKYTKKLNLETTPTILLNPEDYNIIFNGAPVGHEFNSLMNTIIMVSQKDSHLSEESKKKIKEISKETRIRTFVTPMCPYCPGMVILGNKAAIQNKNIIAEFVEATENLELSKKFNVSSVPQQSIDEKMDSKSVGAKNEEMFVEYLIKFAK